MGELGYTEFFLTCAKNLSMEKVMRRSPNGKKVNVILEKILELEERELVKVAILLGDKVGACIIAGKKIKLCQLDRRIYGRVSIIFGSIQK